MTSPAQALRAYLDRERDALFGFTRELVSIESHATQPAGVEAVGDRVAGALEAIGYATTRARGKRLAPEQRWLEEVMLPGFDAAGLADHRVVRKRGSGAGRVLLLGDLDTAFPPGITGRFAFRVEGERALGPGIADMKGGLAVMVYALKALQATGLDTPGETVVVLSADEQAGSLTARSVIEAEARRADWAFCLECARDGGNLMGARAQIGAGRLEARGRDAHAGSAYGKGVSAILAMAHKVLAVHALTDPARDIYLCVGQVQGGWRRTAVPGHCAATIDVRTPSATAWAEVEAALHEIAARAEVPGSATALRLACHRPALPWTKDTDRLIGIAREAGAELGVAFGVARSYAAGSSAFVGPLGVPCLDGMGPSGGDLMTDAEHIVIPTLVERAALLATVLHKLGAGAWTPAGPADGRPQGQKET
jgi:glutamate carboxypeptidase